MNNTRELEREIARLESVNDHMETEIHHYLLQEVGFEGGLATLKDVATAFVEDGMEIA